MIRHKAIHKVKRQIHTHIKEVLHILKDGQIQYAVKERVVYTSNDKGVQCGG